MCKHRALQVSHRLLTLSACARCGSHPALLTHRLLDPWRPRSPHCLPSQPVQGESHCLGCSVPPLTLLRQLLSLKSVVVPSSIRSPVVEDAAPSLCVSFSSIVVPRLLVALSSVDTLRLLLTLSVPQSFLPWVTLTTPTWSGSQVTDKHVEGAGQSHVRSKMLLWLPLPNSFAHPDTESLSRIRRHQATALQLLPCPEPWERQQEAGVFQVGGGGLRTSRPYAPLSWLQGALLRH